MLCKRSLIFGSLALALVSFPAAGRAAAPTLRPGQDGSEFTRKALLMQLEEHVLQLQVIADRLEAMVSFAAAPVRHASPQGEAGGPVISDVAVTAGKALARISWYTDEDSDSVVRFGDAPDRYDLAAIGFSVPEGGRYRHVVSLADLAPGVAYSYRIESTDGAGNRASLEGVFHTKMLPQVSGGVQVFPSAETMFIAVGCDMRANLAILWGPRDVVAMDHGRIEGGYMTNLVSDCEKGKDVALFSLVNYTGGGAKVAPGTDYVFQIFYLQLAKTVDNYLTDRGLRMAGTDMRHVRSLSYVEDASDRLVARVTDITAHSARVAWQGTHLPHHDVLVAYADSPFADLLCDEADCRRRGVRLEKPDAPAGGRIMSERGFEYYAWLTDLEPGTTYAVRARGGIDYAPDQTVFSYGKYGAASDMLQFTTLK